jgi:hypothetical protein
MQYNGRTGQWELESGRTLYAWLLPDDPNAYLPVFGLTDDERLEIATYMVKAWMRWAFEPIAARQAQPSPSQPGADAKRDSASASVPPPPPDARGWRDPR